MDFLLQKLGIDQITTVYIVTQFGNLNSSELS